MLENITIRQYQDSDWYEICKIHDDVRPIEVESFVPCAEVFGLTKVAQEDGFFEGDCFVACVNDRAVGFVCIEPPELSWLYVSPKHHRQGIGNRLIEYVLLKLGKDAFLTTALENASGVAFYY